MQSMDVTSLDGHRDTLRNLIVNGIKFATATDSEVNGKHHDNHHETTYRQ